MTVKAESHLCLKYSPPELHRAGPSFSSLLRCHWLDVEKGGSCVNEGFIQVSYLVNGMDSCSTNQVREFRRKYRLIRRGVSRVGGRRGET